MRYEYKVVVKPDSTSATQIENALNNQVTMGWELVNVILSGTDFVFYLKRLIVR